MDDLLQVLRSATRALHDQLDGAAPSARITDGTLDRDDYRKLIDWQRRAHGEVEVGLSDFAWPSEYRYVARLPLLEAEASRLELPSLPPRSLLAPSSLAEATGRAYVLEGSSLGGNMIVSHLQQNPALAVVRPFSFYGFQREHGLAQWRAFTAFAKTRSWTPAEIEESVVAAQAVFAVFGENLNEPYPPA